ncbi:MAG: hypothetical protein ACLFQ3_09100 [Thiohalorhabdus sp.]
MYQKAILASALATVALAGPGEAAPDQEGAPRDPDQRQVLDLPPDERHLVLEEMRNFLVAMQEITAGLAVEDMQKVADAARRMGGQAANEIPPRVVEKLPDTFKRLAGKVHTTFDRIAMDAESMGDRALSLEQLARLQQQCVACHATYQIEKRPFETAE